MDLPSSRLVRPVVRYSVSGIVLVDHYTSVILSPPAVISMYALICPVQSYMIAAGQRRAAASSPTLVSRYLYVLYLTTCGDAVASHQSLDTESIFYSASRQQGRGM